MAWLSQVFKIKKRAKNNERGRQSDAIVYAWRGRPMRDAPIVYVYIWRVDARSLDAAIHYCRTVREFVLSQLIRKNPPDSLKLYYAEIAAIWDEVSPPHFRVPQEHPTHIIEVGLQDDGLPRSPFLEGAFCLNPLRGDRSFADFAAIEIGGFIQWQFGTWTRDDFVGAALDEKPARSWVLQCVFAKWKALRNG